MRLFFISLFLGLCASSTCQEIEVFGGAGIALVRSNTIAQESISLKSVLEPMIGFQYSALLDRSIKMRFGAYYHYSRGTLARYTNSQGGGGGAALEYKKSIATIKWVPIAAKTGKVEWDLGLECNFTLSSKINTLGSGWRVNGTRSSSSSSSESANNTGRSTYIGVSLKGTHALDMNDRSQLTIFGQISKSTSQEWARGKLARGFFRVYIGVGWRFHQADKRAKWLVQKTT